MWWKCSIGIVYIKIFQIYSSVVYYHLESIGREFLLLYE
jgi:hypothetical protein